MSLPPDYLPLPSSPGKRRISIEERRAMDAERVKAAHLRALLDQEMEVRGIRDPAEIGAMIGLAPMEAEKLLIRRHWRAGDLALLERIAAQLGVQVQEA